MTDTSRPRSNAISPVVFMGSGGPDTSKAKDLTPEAVERLAEKLMAPADRFYLGYGQNAAATLRALSAALEAERDKEHDRAEAAEVKLKEAVDTAKQAIDVIASVQDYKQPDDPTEENALTMCEHEVFDFDVESARAFLASLEGDKPDE